MSPVDRGQCVTLRVDSLTTMRTGLYHFSYMKGPTLVLNRTFQEKCEPVHSRHVVNSVLSVKLENERTGH